MRRTNRLTVGWARPFALTCLAVAGLSAGGPTSNEIRLIEAVKAADVEAVRELLKRPLDVNTMEGDGTTALHWAARSDDLSLVEMLLAAGASADAANRYGVTPLSQAALNGSATMVARLLKAGADPNGTLSRGQTILMTASRTGNAEAVKALLDHGADVNASESSLGETALMWAAAENHAAVVKTLVAYGADVEARSKTLTFPRDRFGLEGVLTILPKGHWTALMYSAREGATEAISALAEAGADVNAVDPDGTTSLVRAIINAHYDAAGVLIEAKADPNIADSAGMAALYAAVDMSSLGEVYGRPARKVDDKLSAVDIISMLLDHGADPNAQLKSPALQRNHTPGEPLLGQGATPLMRAAKNGDSAAMRLLLEYGADPAIAQKNNTTALMLAAGLGRGLGVFAKDVGTEADLRDAVTLCLDQGVDADATDDTGQMAMHYAAQAGLNNVVRVLASRGAKLDAKDNQGRSPVDVALGVGGRGRAGGPPISHEDTATLIRELGGT